MISKHRSIEELRKSWADDNRWKGIARPYSPEDVDQLRGTIRVEHSLARMGAERLWALLHTDDYLPALGALTGNQAVQQVEAGLKVIYLSGWQVAADNNLALEMYPDQSLYPVEQRAERGQAHQQRAHARRSDPARRRARRQGALLVRPDRRRRRGRFRRRPQRLRADEADDRSGRRRRALRGSALLRQEVRPHGRQGAGADAGVRSRS